MKLTYPACLYPCEEKPEGYTVEIPDLPGCVTESDTLADALLWLRCCFRLVLDD